MLRGIALPLALVLAAADGGAPEGSRGVAGAPERQGRIVLDGAHGRIGIPAVAFDHGVHRALYTCRVCHIDLGFALKAGETPISARSNEAGSHCGACHDGRKRHGGAVTFAACSGWPIPDERRGCTRCHGHDARSKGPAQAALEQRLPVDASGATDWFDAERRGLIEPLDAIEGVAVKPPPMTLSRDLTMRGVTWLKPVTFSHAHHARWNGCGMCHPEVFTLGHREPVTYRMADMQAGRYCGVCHVRVAFPLERCPRCHVDRRTLREATR